MNKDKSSIMGLLEKLGHWMMADPEEYGYSEDKIAEITKQARGKSVTQASLLGQSHEPLTVIENLQEGEQPHYCIPVSGFEMEGIGQETEGGAGRFVVTEERIILNRKKGISASTTTVDYDSIEAVELAEGFLHTRLTLHTKSGSFSVKSAESEWGDEMENARETIQEFR
ncbi:hypothetical protein EKH57_07120 [Halorubrum sp. BOL3-1]|uniref:PH domain-containing protein n=1 Tax=Halorubrum sp. BOL3-1 TaxID=2497325 RepID=UPI001004E7EF|nr:PH domain-containing protein [Halorubrum sp. BOL3-1]QAU12511.1 hypothetical protein EKH57_07120 [Halorubrum sp. BOL3-1]